MIFCVDSNNVHPRFWIRELKAPHRDDFLRILKFLRKSTSWNQVLWTLVVSSIITSHCWYPKKSPYVPWFIFTIIDFLCVLIEFLVFSNVFSCFLVHVWCSLLSTDACPWRRVLRTPSPSARGSAPSSPLCVSTNFQLLKRPFGCV